MSRKVCKSKQIPRIFQRRNQTEPTAVRDFVSPDFSSFEGNVASVQANSISNLILQLNVIEDKQHGAENRNRRVYEKETPASVDYSSKGLNVLTDDASIAESLLDRNARTSEAVDDIEKWLKTRTDSVSSMDLETMKSVEEEKAGENQEDDEDGNQGVGGYLTDDLPHTFLSKDTDGLSIDIDLSDKKLNLDYDPLLRELQNDKLLEACEKNDDFIMPEFRLDHLDPLVLSPHDMMVAGEILPSAGHHSEPLVEMELEDNLENGNDEKNERSGELEAGNLTDKPVDVDYSLMEELEEIEQEKSDGLESNIQHTESHEQVFEEAEIVDNGNKNDTRTKSEPRIMQKRRKIRPKSDKNEISYLEEPCHIDGKDSVMTVVAISTDKISNMTQIVINTGMDEQVYQGKTSELIEATGNFPKISKIEIANGLFPTRDRPHERMVSKALEELGITDDSLKAAFVNANGGTWLCPRDECNREFCKLHAFKAHLLTHFGVRPFKCDYEGCTWAFHSEFKLRRHKETHMKRKNFVCEVPGCNRRFTTVYNLWSHAKLHTRPNRVVCQVPDCQEKFQTKRALELHMKNHDQSHAPYQCNHEGCGKRYYTSNALTSHQRCHNYKETDVKCSWPGCGKIFDKPCRLKAHVRSHTGSKPYSCTYQDCQWAFSSSSKLKRHQKKHTNERKFLCNVEGCGKAFMRSEHLKEHLLTHAGGGYFQCYMCGARFSAKSSLYVHIKKHQVKDAVGTIAEGPMSKRRIREAQETKENSMGRLIEDPEDKETEGYSFLQSETIEDPQNPSGNAKTPRKLAKQEKNDLLYNCGMDGCGKSFKALSDLATHMISSHDNPLPDEEASTAMTSATQSSDLDYILYALPNTYPKTTCRAMMLEPCDTVIMNENSKNVACLPEPEPPPPEIVSSSCAENGASESSYRGEKRTDPPTRIRKTYQGSARTGLTYEDVWKLKKKVTEPANVGATDVVLSEANLSESLLLTEELPSMYYQDDIVGTECQILLLDAGASDASIDLRGLE